MSRRILALGFTVALFSSALAVPATSSASQSGVTGDPWVDQYIEQLPTASGGKPSTGSGRSGLSRSQIQALANAGGDRFAAAAALAVVPIERGDSTSGKTARGSRGSAASDSNQVPSSITAVIDSIKGSDEGLGPVLPAVLILSLVGVLAFAAVRARRSSNS